MIFIFANSVKRHICHAKKSRLGHDLPTSKSDRMILSFCEGFIFTKLRTLAKFRENKTLATFSEFTILF